MYNLKFRIALNNKMMLTEDYTFACITVPEGYISDGLTIPVWFRVFVNKYSPKYLPCAFIHDYLTDEAVKGKATFKEADNLFEEMLCIADGGALTYRAKTMVFGVRLYHKLKYGV